MADLITLTTQPIRLDVTKPNFGTLWRQPIFLAVDVSAYDGLDLQLYVAAVEGTTPNITIQITTGMQVQTDDGWFDCASFGSVTASNTMKQVSIGNNNATNPTFLRYIRWDVTGFTGTSAFATFFIRGMGRRFS